MQITLPYSNESYEIRDALGKDLRVLADSLKGNNLSEVEQVYTLISLLATPTLSPAMLDEMDAEDVTALMSAIKSQRAFGTRK